MVASVLIGSAALVPARACAAPPDAFAVHPYAPHVAEAGQRFGIPPDWIWQVMRAESRGKPRAVSRAGAVGLMQIMPATWTMLSARYRLGSDPFDIRANIHGGAAYLRMMWDRYGDVKLMLAAYNAGPGRADDYVAGRRRLPAETIAYIAAIMPGLNAAGLASRAAAPSPQPHAWQQAPVFAPRESHPIASTGDASAMLTDSASDAPLVSPSLLPETAPHPLFIRVSGGEQ
uniref:Lytic transglycosylase, catalytic n=1 Tax=uncultured bacterium UPO61 TaxID=1776982 RepID=A0A126SYN8_9BACT|nr:lytic transglycosylase, catalytic [uncultured bacterium UPO61]